MHTPIYIAAYHQSPFGKLGSATVPDIIARAATETCGSIQIDPALVDVGAIGAACNFSLNQQGLLAGLVAMVPGLGGKPIEAVENACASGGQAIVSVIQKLLAGDGDVGIALGYEKMRGADGKADGKRIGEVLGYFSHPDEREGKVFVFPHLFAEVMQEYMTTYGVTERELASIAVQEYASAQHNPFAQMRNVQLTIEQALAIDGPNRCIVDGLPLKTFGCSQITDGYAGMVLATARGLERLGIRKGDCVEIAGYGQATDPLEEGRARRAAPARRVRRDDARLRPRGRDAGGGQRGGGPRLLHDHGRAGDGGDRQGRSRPGRAVLGRWEGGGRGRVRDQLVRRPHREGAPDRCDRHRHGRLVRVAAAGQGPCPAAGEGTARRRHLQHRWPDLRVRLHRPEARRLTRRGFPQRCPRSVRRNQ